MKVPTCKLCGKAHWSSEEHDIKESGVPEYVKEMAKGALGGVSPGLVGLWPNDDTNKRTEPTMSPQDVPTPTDVPTGYVPTPQSVAGLCECGRTRDGRHAKCAACRKRAYRERSK